MGPPFDILIYQPFGTNELQSVHATSVGFCSCVTTRIDLSEQ